jgi:hypothetical protein
MLLDAAVDGGCAGTLIVSKLLCSLWYSLFLLYKSGSLPEDCVRG